jgi:hypothetical protein
MSTEITVDSLNNQENENEQINQQNEQNNQENENELNNQQNENEQINQQNENEQNNQENNIYHGSDYGSDYEIDNKNDENENIEQTNTISLSTNGFLEDDINYKKLAYATKKTLKMCEMCGKKYTNDMIIDITNNDLTCYHCFFWINYDLSLRDIADNTVHLTIAEYILKCKDEHDITLCTRHTTHGGCFICEYKSGFPIINIKNSKLIYEETEETEIIVDDENIYNDIPNANEIVIEL